MFIMVAVVILMLLHTENHVNKSDCTFSKIAETSCSSGRTYQVQVLFLLGSWRFGAFLCTWADCWLKLVSLTHIGLDSNCMEKNSSSPSWKKSKRLVSLWCYSTQSCSSWVEKWFRHDPSLGGKKGVSNYRRINHVSRHVICCFVCQYCGQSAGGEVM